MPGGTAAGLFDNGVPVSLRPKPGGWYVIAIAPNILADRQRITTSRLKIG
jgi:hypothetical protein